MQGKKRKKSSRKAYATGKSFRCGALQLLVVYQ